MMQLTELLAEAKLNARPRAEAIQEWQTTLSRLAYAPVDYSSAMIDYQIEYWTGNGVACKDISLLLFHDHRVCGLWPLSLTGQEDGTWRVGSNGAALRSPLFVSGLPQKSVKSLTANCLAFARKLGLTSGSSQLEMVEAFVDTPGLSEWYGRLMEEGACVTVRHDLFLDLSKTMVEIKAGFRKSYKALVTSGSLLWKVQVASDVAEQLWEEFRLLHRTVAGRSTRSDESWRLQHEALVNGQAFFVCLRDDRDRMVGGGLFHVTAHEGLYAIGAYDRSLFDKPLGHVVQYHAIEEMKRRGLRWYKLGARAFPADMPAPSEKDLQISNFKSGFASHLYPAYMLQLSIK